MVQLGRTVGKLLHSHKTDFMKLIMTLFFILFNLFMNAFGQSNTVTSGGTATGSSGTMTFSIGQTFDENYVGSNAKINEGVQQPFTGTGLPVKLISFSAKLKTDKQVELDWLTSLELNCNYFEVQHSTNAFDFILLSKVKRLGTQQTNNYSFIHTLPTIGFNYYRLKMVDKDGTFEFSPVKTINNVGGFYARIYPSPVKDKLQLEVVYEQKNSIDIQIITENGRIILSQNYITEKGKSLLGLNVSSLQKGNYFLRLTSDDKKQTVIMFEKM